ncbi:DNA polymerase III, epsilon subunit [Loktanella atrilutea]|uniref:DNA polymerase III, epsilon subunit n=1 Tax=Loktanella atrilutea TaxID=366533 RepID=A0A1M5DIH0_LOKAT|nr:hypothetical protein [Loktanella atrilutea]SHF66691.1 DNA polymerase III, epsilon subunit [Loktanella atrilutea]
MTLKSDYLVFIDFEASGLGPGTWPIEVGLAWIENGGVRTWSSLIRPEPTWDPDVWSPQAAQIHQIDRTVLEAAPNASRVADELLDRIEGKHIVSDSGHDRFWAEQLLETIDLIPPRFMMIETVIAAACNGNSDIIKHVNAHLRTAPRPHRAGPDAARLADAVLLAMRLQASR